MTLDEAKKLLNACDRDELRDHAFGDRELSWYRKGTFGTENPVEVAYGYQGSTVGVTIVDEAPPLPGETRKSLGSFQGDEAYALLACGTLVNSYRNDETGDDNFIWRP